MLKWHTWVACTRFDDHWETKSTCSPLTEATAAKTFLETEKMSWAHQEMPFFRGHKRQQPGVALFFGGDSSENTGLPSPSMLLPPAVAPKPAVKASKAIGGFQAGATVCGPASRLWACHEIIIKFSNEKYIKKGSYSWSGFPLIFWWWNTQVGFIFNIKFLAPIPLQTCPMDLREGACHLDWSVLPSVAARGVIFDFYL